MRRTDPRPRSGRLFAVAAAAAVASFLIGRGGEEAAGQARVPGFDPARQRGEMVELLRSIDARLKRLVELQTPAAAEER